VRVEVRRLCAAVLITAAFFSAALAASALWIPLKAEAAQWLMRKTWQEILAGNSQARPWPWADTRPAAILRVPRRHIELFVLEGNSGRNLAFGPVLAPGLPGSKDRVISGHRDTHFHFLEALEPGESLSIETPGGIEEYVVERAEVVDSRRRQLVLDPAIRRLSLVTCYPFHAPTAGGPLRYVVTALGENWGQSKVSESIGPKSPTLPDELL
jgi:sortase A